MKRTIILFILALTLGGVFQANAQRRRVGERAWHAIRGGLLIGVNESYHNGDVPFLPIEDNMHYGKGSGTNFLFGLHGEKAASRHVVFGLRILYNDMSGDVEGTVTEPFRISDDDGVVYDLSRAYKTDYTLQYLAFSFYTKLYVTPGPSFFIKAGASIASKIKSDYSSNVAITEPDWAAGSTVTYSGGIDDVNKLRYSVDVGIGYDIWYRYGFITPQVEYEFGLNNVTDANYGKSWKIDNLRFLVLFTFPVP